MFGRNVGFLRYWTPSNIPLFALATPMLCALFTSSWQALRGQLSPLCSPTALLRRLALPQLLLAVLALSVFHVQVITRIASGYPVVYIWAALIIEKEVEEGAVGTVKRWGLGRVIVGFCVVYAVVQGGLFASFMPPA